MPFALGDHPGVPPRDKYMNERIVGALMHPTMKRKTLASLSPTGEDNTDLSVGSVVNNTRATRKGSIWGGQIAVNGFARNDIDSLVNHMFQNTGPRGLDLSGFDSVLKKHIAFTKTLTNEEYCRRALCTIELFLQLLDLSLYSWFVSVETVGQGKLSRFKFQHCLKELAFKANQPEVWSDRELHAVTTFICGNRNEITLYDIEKAYEQIHNCKGAYGERMVVGALLSFVRGVMKQEKLRVVDMFGLVDTDRTGFVTREQMTQAIKALVLDPSSLKVKKPEPSGSALYYGDQPRGGELQPISDPNGDFYGAAGVTTNVPFSDFDLPAGNKKKKKTYMKRKNEEEEFVRLLKDSQDYLDAKVDGLDKTNMDYRVQVQNRLSKYLKSTRTYDRHIDRDLQRLLNI